MDKEQKRVQQPEIEQSFQALASIVTEHIMKTAPRSWMSYKNKTGATVIFIQKI